MLSSNNCVSGSSGEFIHHAVERGGILRAGANQQHDGRPWGVSGRVHGIPPLRVIGQALKKTRRTVLAGLASGRSSHNYAQAEFPPISRKGFLFGRRPDKGRLCVCSCDDDYTIASTPDLCKSGGFLPENTNGFRRLSATQQAYRS